jgi:hypothetical protein
MTADEAKRILRPVMTANGSLSTKTGYVPSTPQDAAILDTYIDWDARYPDAKIVLDGFYSVVELEAMVVWIRHMREFGVV